MSDPIARFTKTFANERGGYLTRRLAIVEAVSNTYTLTVKVPAADGVNYERLTGVRYFGHHAPHVGAQVWLDSDGANVVAIGAVAGLGGSALAARVGKNSNQNAPNSATQVTFADVLSDPASMFDNANDNFVIPVRGFYFVLGSLVWSAVTDKEARSLTIRVNGNNRGTVRTDNIGHAAHSLAQQVSVIYPMSVGDTVGLYANQETTGTLTNGMQSDNGTFFSIAYLGADA